MLWGKNSPGLAGNESEGESRCENCEIASLHHSNSREEWGTSFDFHIRILLIITNARCCSSHVYFFTLSSPLSIDFLSVFFLIPLPLTFFSRSPVLACFFFFFFFLLVSAMKMVMVRPAAVSAPAPLPRLCC